MCGRKFVKTNGITVSTQKLRDAEMLLSFSLYLACYSLIRGILFKNRELQTYVALDSCYFWFMNSVQQQWSKCVFQQFKLHFSFSKSC